MGQIRRVLVLYVGGTIGMQRNDKGVLVPAPNAFLQKIKFHSEMHDVGLAQKYVRSLKENELILPLSTSQDTVVYQIEEYVPLLDSSNMSCREWIRIAKDIEKHYNIFDGFVVLHGTDTLAYTSSVLSFMLKGLGKPVVITGSQIPIFETRSDAKDNFLSSLIIAGCYNIPEVTVFFGNKLFRGNRVAKISSDALDAFDSPNYHPLANVGIQVKVNRHYIKKYNANVPFEVSSSLSRHAAILAFFPTISCQMLESFLKPPMEGLIIQTYGAGNFPSKRTDLLEVLKRAVKRNVVIINITQCARGAVSISYEAGKALEEIGIISGKDMTAEAALTKLIYVLGLSGLTYQQRVELMKSDLRGELSK